jgi:hypothetical protein
MIPTIYLKLNIPTCGAQNNPYNQWHPTTSIPFTPTVTVRHLKALEEAKGLLGEISEELASHLKELVTIYIMNADFEESEGISDLLDDAEDRYDLAVKYLNKHPNQKEVLEEIFPMHNETQKNSSQAKLITLTDFCNDLMMKAGAKNGDKNRYENAITAFRAINTLYYAIGRQGNYY